MINTFDTRNKKITKLIQLGDYIGYTIRENIQLFSVDGLDHTVSYLTESNYIIKGNYSFKNNEYSLTNILSENTEAILNEEKFDSGVKNQVSLFLENLYNDEYTGATDTFSDVIDILLTRSKYNNVSEKLQKKINIFNNSQNIMESDEYTRFLEIVPDIVSFLKENKDQIHEQVPEIVNSLKLSEAVSKAFNIPYMSIEDLSKLGRYTFNNISEKPIYEMICRQELVKKELLEAKSEFDLVWSSEPVIDSLTSKIYSSEEDIEEVLYETIKELPYFCLLSKKKIFETLSRNLGHSTEHISEQELKTYSSKLFEMKKPSRRQLTNLLNQKYGINLQYLKESYSFKSLLNTQVVLFESISKISPNNSVIKQILTEFSSYLKDKNGIQGLELNSIIQQVFQHAGYSQEDIPLMEQFSFSDVKKIFKNIQLDSANSLSEATTKEKIGTNDKEEKEEEVSTKEEQADSEDLQKEEVAEEGEERPAPIMSDDAVMKAIKSLSDIVNGTEVDYSEDE
tara:strand:- start:999 stop:2528 length:1530 start_codon:yes stop_codon:yes gene_type:complete